MVMPNFIILGTAKGGTTSLYYYLNQHPQIYMSPKKETRFFALEGETLNFKGPDELFARNTVTDLASYQALFNGVVNEIAIGEASPLYLYSEKAPHNIKQHVPDVKLIVILRDPVDRAYASYMHNVREGYEKDSFAVSLSLENQRIQDNWIYLWHYKKCGYYYQQLKRYLDIFKRSQLGIYLYDDLAKDTLATVQNIFQFLEVNDTFVPDLTVMNASGIPKSRLVYNFVNRGNPVRNALKTVVPDGLRKNIAQHVRKRNLEKKPPLLPAIRNSLIDQYRDDILSLQVLLQRDLSEWLKYS